VIVTAKKCKREMSGCEKERKRRKRDERARKENYYELLRVAKRVKFENPT
jgi:hypothetical protein